MTYLSKRRLLISSNYLKMTAEEISNFDSKIYDQKEVRL